MKAGSRRRRRLVFVALLLGLVVGAVEAGGFATWWALTGQPFSWSAAAQLRAAVTGEEQGAEAGLVDAATNPGMTLHPYLGFVASHELGEQQGFAVNDYGYDSSEQMLNQIRTKYGTIDELTLRQDVDKLLNFVQDAIDKYFDKFELYALNNVFRVPTEVSEAPEDGADQSGIDAELEELWAQLRQELATKSELQQRVAAASRESSSAGSSPRSAPVRSSPRRRTISRKRPNEEATSCRSDGSGVSVSRWCARASKARMPAD